MCRSGGPPTPFPQALRRFSSSLSTAAKLEPVEFFVWFRHQDCVFWLMFPTVVEVVRSYFTKSGRGSMKDEPLMVDVYADVIEDPPAPSKRRLPTNSLIPAIAWVVFVSSRLRIRSSPRFCFSSFPEMAIGTEAWRQSKKAV